MSSWIECAQILIIRTIILLWLAVGLGLMDLWIGNKISPCVGSACDSGAGWALLFAIMGLSGITGIAVILWLVLWLYRRVRHH